MQAVEYKTNFTAWSTDEEDERMLPDTPSPMNKVRNHQLDLKLVDICFDNTPKIVEGLLLKSRQKIWLVNFECMIMADEI